MFDPLVADAQRTHRNVQPACIEKCRDGFADASAQGAVLDRHHAAELRAHFEEQFLVERFGEAQVVMAALTPFFGSAYGSACSGIADRSDGHQRHIRSVAELAPPGPRAGFRTAHRATSGLRRSRGDSES